MRETFWAIYALAYDVLTKMKPYDHMLKEAIDLLDVNPNDKVLDLGCGTGNLIKGLIAKKASVVGVDFSSAMLNRAARKFSRDRRLTLRRVDLSHQPLPYSPNTFDSAALINVLHALQSPDLMLREVNRVVKNKGRVVIATPSPGAAPLKVFQDHLKMTNTVHEKFALIYIIPALFWVLLCNLFMLGRSKFYDQSEISHLLNSHGLNIIKKTRTYADQNILILAEVFHGR